jgi:hypothetical protein
MIFLLDRILTPPACPRKPEAAHEVSGATVFAFGCVKHAPVAQHREESLYTTHVQGTLHQFERFRRNTGGAARGQGSIIMDRRTENLNQVVLASAQSDLFSNPVLNGPQARIVETPLLVPSEYYHGVQAADIIGRVVAAVHRWLLLHDAHHQWADTVSTLREGALRERLRPERVPPRRRAAFLEDRVTRL